jgi:hypothetical protein
MKGLRVTAAIAAVCGLLAVAPAAPAKTVPYQGPVDQPQLDPYQKPPRIEFKVRFKKNKKGDSVPKSVKVLEAQNLWFQCEHPVPDSGDPSTIFYPGQENESTSSVLLGVEFPIKQRKFSASDSDYGTGIHASGELNNKAGAEGTVRITYTSQPGDDFQVGSCDSGALKWTASSLKPLE